MKVAVIGNVTLDVICQSVDAVPRYDSITFNKAAVSPGGCGSNVAIGLAALGVPTTLISCLGTDDAAEIIRKTWDRVGLDYRFTRQVDGNTGVSIGLIDHDAQPRFIHTSGANAHLSANALDIDSLYKAGVKYIHIAGYFVLPGMLDNSLGAQLGRARELGFTTSLDVVRSPRMDQPQSLWPCLTHLDIFQCNEYEGWRLSGEKEPAKISKFFHSLGARTVIIKLGAKGCWLSSEGFADRIPGRAAKVKDTTGAGDGFAAGLLSALARGDDILQACITGNKIGASVVQELGAVSVWLNNA